MIAMPRPLVFSRTLASVAYETRSATQVLNLPKGATPIVDPVVPATAHAKSAVEMLGGALANTTGLPREAVYAATRAQSELTTGVNLLTHRLNGPLPTGTVTTKFNSTLTWLNLAQQYLQLSR